MLFFMPVTVKFYGFFFDRPQMVCNAIYDSEGFVA